MSDNTKDTETTVMKAWLERLEADQPKINQIKYGIPVADPSSQLPEPKDIDESIRFGLIHN